VFWVSLAYLQRAAAACICAAVLFLLPSPVTRLRWRTLTVARTAVIYFSDQPATTTTQNTVLAVADYKDAMFCATGQPTVSICGTAPHVRRL